MIITSFLGVVLYFVLNVSKRFSILSTTGTAICGATAVSSVSPLINAKSNEVGAVLSIIFILNAVAMIFYPVIADALTHPRAVWRLGVYLFMIRLLWLR